MRLFVQLSYDGSPFCGWQSQPNGESVQSNLERALTYALGHVISVVGAGRTDAGVNARGYIAHFDTHSSIEKPAQTIHKINAILPRKICVHALYSVDDAAHARFDATSRTYRYYIHTSKDPFATYSYQFTFPLDFEAMNEAASHFLGIHDFSSLEKKGGDNTTSICNVTRAVWSKVDECHYVFTVTSDRFLRNMVRAMVGTLLEVGRGKRPASWTKELLDEKDRCLAGQSVPAQGLFLDEITYPYILNKI